MFLTSAATFFSPGGPSLQSRHHPEHCQSCGHRSRHPGAVLRPGEDEPPQRSLPGSQQEHGAEGLPRHVGGYVRLPIRLERKERRRLRLAVEEGQLRIN